MAVTNQVIDCDIHNAPPSHQAILPYMSDYWQEYVTQSDFKGPPANLYAPALPVEGHPDTKPASGGLAGSDLSLLRRQLFDELGVDYAILNCAYAVESIRNPYGAAAFAGAVNDWLVKEWLEPEPRLRAALVVPSQEPELAAQEIERVGGHPGFAQVYLPAHSAALYGTRRYHPIYKAAVEHNLVIGIHFGGAPGSSPTASGWPTYFVEEYAGMTHIFQSHLINLIVEGVFEQFPALKVVLLASGFTWLPSLMWRLDKEWKGLRREIPWVKRPPSDYIRQHVRFTLQPVDAPPNPQHMAQIVEQMGSDELLLYSSDYPYNCFKSASEALPPGLSADLQHKILYENAQAFYGF
jgi:hypothetical protein